MRRYIGLFSLVFAVGCQATEPVPAADLIIHNAIVYTGNDALPKAEAVAVRGGRFIVVGSNADALKLRGSNTRVIDGEGRAVLPGLQDAHGHFTNLGESLQVLGRPSLAQPRQVDRSRPEQPGVSHARGRSRRHGEPGGDGCRGTVARDARS